MNLLGKAFHALRVFVGLLAVPADARRQRRDADERRGPRPVQRGAGA
jgi:hypothetical protein